MAIGKDFMELERIVGYSFSDFSYLEVALTHVSYSNELKARGVVYKSNERLEFLGDAVLQIVISDLLYKNYDKCNEGILTKMRQYLVCQKTLAKIAEKYSLGDYINVAVGEEANGLRHRPRILANTVEALVAAIYLDAKASGRDYVMPILNLFGDEIENAASVQWGDYKSLLQMLVEKSGDDVLEYVTEEAEGPEHDKVFTVVAKINNNEVGRGSAKRLKDAQMKAAGKALSLFGINL